MNDFFFNDFCRTSFFHTTWSMHPHVDWDREIKCYFHGIPGKVLMGLAAYADLFLRLDLRSGTACSMSCCLRYRHK